MHSLKVGLPAESHKVVFMLAQFIKDGNLWRFDFIRAWDSKRALINIMKKLEWMESY